MSETIKCGHGGARPGAGRPRKIEPVLVIPPTSRWCVYQTHPQAERLAAEDLTRAGYRGYAPLIAIRKQDAVIRSLFHKVRVARFPGYGFVELSPGEPWHPILEADGVARILRSPDGRPARLPAGEIERHMQDDDRLCDLARDVMPAIKPGTTVNVVDGAFAGRAGIVEECNGLATKVALQGFGRIIGVWIARSSVAV